MQLGLGWVFLLVFYMGLPKENLLGLWVSTQVSEPCFQLKLHLHYVHLIVYPTVCIRQMHLLTLKLYCLYRCFSCVTYRLLITATFLLSGIMVLSILWLLT